MAKLPSSGLRSSELRHECSLQSFVNTGRKLVTADLTINLNRLAPKRSSSRCLRWLCLTQFTSHLTLSSAWCVSTCGIPTPQYSFATSSYSAGPEAVAACIFTQASLATGCVTTCSVTHVGQGDMSHGRTEHRQRHCLITQERYEWMTTWCWRTQNVVQSFHSAANANINFSHH